MYLIKFFKFNQGSGYSNIYFGGWEGKGKGKGKRGFVDLS